MILRIQGFTFLIFFHFDGGCNFGEAFFAVEDTKEKVRHFLALSADIRSFKVKSPSLQEGSSTTTLMATSKDPSRCSYLFYHKDLGLM